MLTEEQKQWACKACKLCCQVIGFPTQYPVTDSFAKELYEARGWNTKEVKGRLWFYKNVPCPHLTTEGCDIYETRPAACKMYDGRRDPILRDSCLWTTLKGGQ